MEEVWHKTVLYSLSLSLHLSLYLSLSPPLPPCLSPSHSLILTDDVRNSTNIHACGLCACYMQGKSKAISPHLTQSSTFLHGTCCKLLTAKPLQRNTQYLPPREIADHHLRHFEIENNQFASLRTPMRSMAAVEYFLVNMHTLIAEGQFARLMQKSMLRRYKVCS